MLCKKTIHKGLFLLKKERNEHTFRAKKNKLHFKTGRWDISSAQPQPCVCKTEKLIQTSDKTAGSNSS